MYALAKIAILVFVILGYGMLYQKKRLPLCFFPAACVAGISLALYGFGLIGLLKPGCYAVIAAGILMLVLYGRPERIKAFFCEPAFWFFLFSAAWLYVITSSAMLSRWDDGSHWYRVCKSIFYEDAFPTTPDILYYDYPTGLQVWNYFLMKFIGFSIPHCFFAQNLVNIACICALFAGIRGISSRLHKAICTVIIGLAGIKLCSMSMGTYTLMVDLQVGLVTMAALIFMLDQGEKRESVLMLMAMLAFLSVIKNNGPLFAALVIVWAVFRYRYKGRALVTRVALWGGVSAAAYGAYKLRSMLVYHSASGGPQGISLTRFSQMLAQKDGQTILEITKVFWGEVFLGMTGQNVTLYVCAALLVLLILALRDEKLPLAANQVKQVLVGLAVILGVYSLSLYVTYLLAMTVDEALRAFGFVRYFGSAVCIAAGVTVYTALCQFAAMQKEGRQSPRYFVLGFTLFAVMAMQGLGTDEYILGRDKWNMPGRHHPSVWYALEYFVPQNMQYTEDSYLVLWDADDFDGEGLDNTRMMYNAGAWMRSSDVRAVSKRDLKAGLNERTLASLASYDYLICMSDMTDVAGALEEALGVTDFTVGMRAIGPQ